MTDVFDGCLFIGSTGLFNEQFLSEKVDFSKLTLEQFEPGNLPFDLPSTPGESREQLEPLGTLSPAASAKRRSSS